MDKLSIKKNVTEEWNTDMKFERFTQLKLRHLFTIIKMCDELQAQGWTVEPIEEDLHDPKKNDIQCVSIEEGEMCDHQAVLKVNDCHYCFYHLNQVIWPIVKKQKEVIRIRRKSRTNQS